MTKGSLVLIMDKIFMYLIDSQTQKLKQRLRHSSFAGLLPYTRWQKLQEHRPIIFANNIFCKLNAEDDDDPGLFREGKQYTLMIEFFKVDGFSVKEVEDLDLLDTIREELKSKQLEFYFLQSLKMSKSKIMNSHF